MHDPAGTMTVCTLPFRVQYLFYYLLLYNICNSLLVDPNKVHNNNCIKRL